MNIDYFKLLKQAYNITIHHPLLWVFGLFMSGGFNSNFLYFANVPFGWRDRSHAFMSHWVASLHSRSSVRSVAVSLILFAITLVIVNWVKIIFVLKTSGLLGLQRRLSPQAQKQQVNFELSFREIITESLNSLSSVLAASIVTMIFVAIVFAILASVNRQFGSIWTDIPWVPVLGIALASVLVIALSLINLFTAFFIILYRYRVIPAFTLAVQLIRKRWLPILETVIILMVIYGLCFFVGTSLVHLIRSFDNPDFIMYLQAGILVWIWLAIVNVLFNVSLLMLFSLLVQPPLYPEFVKETVPQVAPSMSGGA